MPAETVFDRQTLKQALNELGQRAYAEDKTVEIAVYGGSALMLTYDWRIATRDVDAVFEADRLIEPKTRFGLEEIFEKLARSGRASDTGPNKP